jgi:hypothetical protein
MILGRNEAFGPHILGHDIAFGFWERETYTFELRSAAVWAF